MSITAMVSVQLGLAVAIGLIEDIGSDGTAWLRLAWAGLLLLIVIRPRPSAFTWHSFGMCVLLGVVTAGITLLFMASLDRIPLGTATALEFLGPLAVAVTHGRGWQRLAWPGLALVGVLLLTQPLGGGIDPKGALLALGAGVCWAIYILLTQRAGDQVEGVTALAVSMPVAALVASFFVSGQVFEGMNWKVLFIGLGMAILLPVIPFVLEMFALRRLTTAAFGTLMSLEPALAFLIGFVVLHQNPGLWETIGIAVVVMAGIGAARSGGREMAVPLEVG